MNAPQTVGEGWLARQPVARKAAIAAAVPVLLGIAILIATQVAMLRRTALDEALRANRITAELMADQMTGGMKWSKHDVVNGVIERVTAGAGSTVAHVAVLDRSGATVALHPAGETEPDVTAILAKLGAGQVTLAETTREHVLVATPIGEFGRLAVAWDRASVTAGSRRTMWLAVGIGILVAAAVATVVVAVLRRTVIAPVGSLTDLLDRLGRGEDGHATDLLRRGDEIGRMANAAERLRRVGIEAREAERDASQRRQSSEAERVAAEALREQASEAQQAVVGLVARALERLAAGDLTHRVVETVPEGYGKLRDDLNTAFEALETALARITDNAEAVRAAATDIASASDDLSRRTESQAASLEQTAAAIEEITATTRSTADNAGRAREVVARAKAEAESGGDVVRQAIGAMSNIEASSEKIGQIIGLIDEISFQTNLLALNAGVEAARAGEAGRGFAVVASEVRALAQRSADAAKEIKGLILSSKQEVEKGVELVGGTGEALERIIARVAEINGAVGEIATSAAEQATGLQEVNGAVSQMDQITQQNAAMVEKATIAVRALSQQTDAFAQLVGRFEVTRHAARPSAPAIAPATPTKPPAGPVPKPTGAHAPGPALVKVKPAAGATPYREALPAATPAAGRASGHAEVHKLRPAAKPAALSAASRPTLRGGASVAAHPAAGKTAAAAGARATASVAAQPVRPGNAPRARRAGAGIAHPATQRADHGGWEEF